MENRSSLVRLQYKVDPPFELQSQFGKVESALEQLRTIVGDIFVRAGSSASAAAANARVHQIIKARRARDRFFHDVPFADPAWDILLEAFAAHLTQRRLSVSGLCHSAAVPLTTALRWVGRLEEDGWLVRREDALDRRRIWIDLSPSAFKTMESYFQFVAAGLPPI